MTFLLHPINVAIGVNRVEKQNWVKAEDTDLTSPLNWPGFHLASAEGIGGKDAKIDFNQCGDFFTEILQDIDINKSGKIIPSEMRAALKNDVLAERMSRVIAKHPSEWQSDAQCSKWEHLKDLVPDDAAFEEAKKQILNMAWWDNVSCAGADLPVGPEVYHLHSLSFIQQLRLLPDKVELRITRFAQWPKKPDALNGIEKASYAKEASPGQEGYAEYQAYIKYNHALNASQGGTHSKFEFVINNTVKLKAYMLEAAGPSSKEAGSDQRIMPGKYSLIDNPGQRGGFRLVHLEKEKAKELFGKRSLVNIHIGNFPKNFEGCFAPGKNYGTLFKGKDNEYPIVTSSEDTYKALKRLIIKHSKPTKTSTHDGVHGYSNILYSGLSVIIKEDFL